MSRFIIISRAEKGGTDLTGSKPSLVVLGSTGSGCNARPRVGDMDGWGQGGDEAVLLQDDSLPKVKKG